MAGLPDALTIPDGPKKPPTIYRWRPKQNAPCAKKLVFFASFCADFVNSLGYSEIPSVTCDRFEKFSEILAPVTCDQRVTSELNKTLNALLIEEPAL
jgi:hypothetical protein